MDAVFIPYKGSAEVVQGLQTGSIGYSFDGVAANLPLIQKGDLRALAKLSHHPLPALPELQSLAVAAQLPALDDVSIWSGLVAPAGTAQPIIERIQGSIARIANDAEIKDKLRAVGIGAVSSTPREFAEFFQKERHRWSQAVTERGFKID
jgi:tripartite-type tricarboxylate transporter receptor subunit TctC